MQFNAMTLQVTGDRLRGNNILQYAVQCNDIAGNTHISTLNTTKKDCGGHNVNTLNAITLQFTRDNITALAQNHTISCHVYNSITCPILVTRLHVTRPWFNSPSVLIDLEINFLEGQEGSMVSSVISDH